MTANPFRITARSPGRRAVLAASAASAGALALTACGGDDSADSAGPLAALDEVPVGEAFAVTTPDGKEAFVFRADETTVAAFSAVCTHRGCAVAAAGAELRCPCHGSVFDAATGERISGLAEDPLAAIPVRVDGRRIVMDRASGRSQ